LEPRLAHALEVKKRMPGRNKTDHLDAKGFGGAVAQRIVAGSLDIAGTSAGFARLDANATGHPTTRQ
jgi:hypothetical protein